MLSERSGADVAVIVANLLAEITQHFQDEERVLRQLGFDKLELHAAEHAQLLTQARHLAGQFEAEGLTIGSLFEFLAYDVIIRHILGSDREYFALTAAHQWSA